MITLRTLRPALIPAALFFLLGLARLNDLSLYADSTRYLIWANSLASLDGYVDTTQPVPVSFVMNAPFYPLMMAPVQLMFPFSLSAAKIWTLLWGTLALLLLYAWLRQHVSATTALAGMILMAVNPLFLVTSTEVLSEAPFIAAVMAVFLSLEEYLRDPREKSARWVLFFSLAVMTLLREVGIAFVLAALVTMFRKKDLRGFVTIALSAGILYLLWIVRNALTGTPDQEGQATNLEYITLHFVTEPGESLIAEFVVRAWLNIKGYAAGIGGMLFFPFPENLVASPSPLYLGLQSFLQSVRVILLGFIVAAAAYGARRDLADSGAGSFRLLAVSFFLLIVLLYPVHDIRFLLPLVPVLLFYVLKTVTAVLSSKEPTRSVRIGIVGLFLAALFPNVVAVTEILATNMAYRSDPDRFYQSAENTSAAAFFGQPWGLLGEWIREHSDDDVVIATPAKEIAGFIERRKALEASRVLPSPIFERVLRDHQTRYLVTAMLEEGIETHMIAMKESRRLWFSPAARFGQLTLYEVHSAILEPQPRKPEIIADDTGSVRALLFAGRNALQNMAYREAIGYYEQARAIEPGQPETSFQLLTALTLAGDSARALQVYEELFTIPQSTAYTQVAQSLLQTMNTSLAARRAQNPVQYGFTAFEAGLSYWGLGFPKPALQTMQNVANADSTNFVGPLWGLHIAKQMGDTALSNRFLDRLKWIDRMASIVQDWDAVKNLEDSLRKATARGERVRLLSGIARIYLKIELFDEALDLLERALVLDRSNIDILLLRAEVLEKKRARWGAFLAYSEILQREPHNTYAKERLDSLRIDL